MGKYIWPLVEELHLHSKGHGYRERKRIKHDNLLYLNGPDEKRRSLFPTVSMPYNSPILYDLRHVSCYKCLNNMLACFYPQCYVSKAHILSDVKWFKRKTMNHFSQKGYWTVSQNSWCGPLAQCKPCFGSDPIHEITLLIKRTEYNLSNCHNRNNLGLALKIQSMQISEKDEGVQDQKQKDFLRVLVAIN